MVQVLMFLPGDEFFVGPVGPWAIPQFKPAMQERKNCISF